jgi:hypothetical protein
MWPWKKAKQPPKAQTAFGEFTKEHNSWLGYTFVGDDEIRIIADDVHGEPNPEFLSLLPNIIEKTPVLEATARAADIGLFNQHYLSSIEEANDATDFSLGFIYDEESWGETVWVYFNNDAVVGHCRMD